MQIGPGRIYRADAPHWLAPDQVLEFFGTNGIATIIDLRVPGERAARPSPAVPLGVRTFALPVEVHVGGGFASVAPILKGATDMTPTYRAMISSSDASITSAVSLALSPERWPVLVHCTAGKDRTGLVVAIMLRSLGVSIDAIATDFHRSESAMPQIMQRVVSTDAFHASAVARLPRWTHLATKSSISTVLEELERDFGSVRKWLVGRGIPAECFNTAFEALGTPPQTAT